RSAPEKANSCSKPAAMSPPRGTYNPNSPASTPTATATATARTEHRAAAHDPGAGRRAPESEKGAARRRSEAQTVMNLTERHRAYWRRNIALTVSLLL